MPARLVVITVPRPIDIIRNSKTYAVVQQVQKWAAESTLAKLLNDERVLVGLLGLFVLFSLVRILASSMHVTVKFLSFALLFVVLAALTWNYTKPLTDE